MARRSGRAPSIGSYPFSTSTSRPASVSSMVMPLTVSCSWSRAIMRVTMALISSRSSLWKTMTSSTRLRNSGLKTRLSSPVMRPFMSS